MKNLLHRSLPLLLAFVMAMSLAVPAWAVDPDEEDGFSLSQTSATLPVGGSLTLTVSFPDGEDSQTVKWTSSNTKAAAVSSNGVVLAIAPGKASITATAGKNTAVCTVTVEENYVVEVSIEPLSPGTLGVGGTASLSAYVTYKYKTDSTGTVTWTTTDSSVATVGSDGLVSALAEGKAMIYATAGDKGHDGTDVTDVYKLTVLPEGGDPAKDLLVLDPAEQNTTGSPTLPLVLHAPKAAVMNGTTDVTDRFTISYLWSYNGKTSAGDTLTFQPLESGEVVCHITAVSNTDGTHILTADGVYAVSLLSGIYADGAASSDTGDVTLGDLTGGAGNRTILEQLQTQAPGLVSLTFDPSTITGDDVGSLIVQRDTPYSVDSAGANPLSALVFSPIQPGEYGISFTAQAGEDGDLYGRLKITVTGSAPQPFEEDPVAIPCQSEGITMTKALTALHPSGDPVVTVVFGSPKHGLLLRDFRFGSGVPAAGERFYTTSASYGDYPLSSLTYVPRAGFAGTEYLPVTVITESGLTSQETLPISVLSKTDSDFFRDVNDEGWGVGAWCADSVDFASACGLMNGTETGLFSPDAYMSRCMLVTVLYRMEGSPAVTTASPYHDVSRGAYYYDAICWAAANGIVTGDEFGYFWPYDAISRESIATILHRYAAYKGQDTDYTRTLAGYRDASYVSSYAINGMSWAVERGIISGVVELDPNDVRLDPLAPATRAQVAVMLHRFLTL